MAGAGFKSFAAGEVLLASEVNTFLMEQTVMVFDSAAARDGVITAPSEGMLCYLKDTNAVEKYTGSDWVAVVESTSPITTEGDLIVGDASGDPVRLPVGAAGEVLTSDGDTVSFVAPASGGSFENYTLLNAGGTALTGATTITISGITDINKLLVHVREAGSVNASSFISLLINNDSAANYRSSGGVGVIRTAYDQNIFQAQSSLVATSINLGRMSNNAASELSASCAINGGRSTGGKQTQVTSGSAAQGGDFGESVFVQGVYEGSAAITSIVIRSSTGNFDTGTIHVFGSSI